MPQTPTTTTTKLGLIYSREEWWDLFFSADDDDDDVFMLIAVYPAVGDAKSSFIFSTSHVQLRQLEMQLEQEYEEKQMVIHEKHDLEGLIATLCDQVGNYSLQSLFHVQLPTWFHVFHKIP